MTSSTEKMTKRSVSLLEPAESSDDGNKPPNVPTKTDVPEDDPLYQGIVADFQDTEIPITKVERLSNPFLQERYLSERSLIHRIKKGEAEDAEPNLNERYLYHGTPGNKLDQICKEGFDSRLAKNGSFGRGIYFSDHPLKCAKYSERGTDQDYYIILVRVLLGESKLYKKGDKDPTLKREPIKDTESGKRYDSVEGFPRQHKEFVVYETRRTLPEAIITYKRPHRKTEPKPATDEQAKATETEERDCADEDTDSEEEDYLIDSSGTESDSEDDYHSTHEDGDKETEKESPNDAEVQALLQKITTEFKNATQETEEHIIDHCLLMGDLKVDEAVKFYNNMGNEPEETEELEDTADIPEVLTPNSEGWDKLSLAEQEGAIKTLVDYFLFVTGLDEKNDKELAKQCLENANHDVRAAVWEFYDF